MIKIYFNLFLTFLATCFFMTAYSREIHLKGGEKNNGISTKEIPFNDLDKAIQMIINIESSRLIFLDENNNNLYVIQRLWELKTNVEILGQTSQINIAFGTNCGIHFTSDNSITTIKNLNFKGENISFHNYSVLRFLNLMISFEVNKKKSGIDHVKNKFIS